VAPRIIPTEPIGSIPRPVALLDAIEAAGGNNDDPGLEPLYDEAVRDTITRFEETGSPVITDGVQGKPVSYYRYLVASGSLLSRFVELNNPARARFSAEERMKHFYVVLAGENGPDYDCCLAPFCDDTSTSRNTAFAKIPARLQGTPLAARELELHDAGR
jgi:hypothetical protein